MTSDMRWSSPKKTYCPNVKLCFVTVPQTSGFEHQFKRELAVGPNLHEYVRCSQSGV